MSNRLASRVRRNHALEHATISVLSGQHKKFSAQGNSTPYGFHLNIYGDVSEEAVRAAVDEAHRRLKEGEKHLALHPNCGTVLLTSATMATLAAQASMSMEQRRQGRSNMSLSVLLNGLPTAIVAVAAAMIASRPLGMVVQDKFTVESDIGDLEVVDVKPASRSLVTRLFQLLLGQANNQHVRSYKVTTKN